ncbi:MAG: TIM barrel protein, partial [Armatimonas sp.]
MPQQRFSICNETFAPLGSPDPWSFERICRFLKETGYDGVELAPFTFAEDIRDLTPVERAEIRQIAADNGLAICGLHWLLISPPGLHIHTSDAALRGKTPSRSASAYRVCSRYWCTHHGAGLSESAHAENGDYESGWHRTAETLVSLGDSLKAAGVGAVRILSCFPINLDNT